MDATRMKIQDEFSRFVGLDQHGCGQTERQRRVYMRDLFDECPTIAALFSASGVDTGALKRDSWWSTDEDAQLAGMYLTGSTDVEIAVELGRSHIAVARRRKRLGLRRDNHGRPTVLAG